jgi:hypothetical protein
MAAPILIGSPVAGPVLVPPDVLAPPVVLAAAPVSAAPVLVEPESLDPHAASANDAITTAQHPSPFRGLIPSISSSSFQLNSVCGSSCCSRGYTRRDSATRTLRELGRPT